jgi:hypothetical protein
VKELQLPTDPEGVSTYLVHRYKGIGKKTAESLIDAVGADKVFRVLQEEPERAREVIGARGADKLLEAWHEDYRQRTGKGGERAEAASSPETNDDAQPAARKTARGGRGRKTTRRGGARKTPR